MATAARENHSPGESGLSFVHTNGELNKVPNRDYLYAFECTCLYLNLAPDYIRCALAQWPT